MSNDTLAWALERLAERRRVVIASVIQTSGSVPGKVGAKLRLLRVRKVSMELWVVLV